MSGTVYLDDIGRAFSGMTFTGCKEITKNAADLSGGNTINGCVDTYAISVDSKTNFEHLQNCTFTNNDVSIRITGNHGGGTWSLAGTTVSGGTGSFDIEYTGTGTLTIEADTGSGWSQSRATATGGGTLTISSPTQALDINSDTALTLIRYFTNDSQTVVDSATGTTLSYEYSNTNLIDIELVKQSYVWDSISG